MIGVNLDDAWRYAGVKEPKSIIIPHFLSLSLPEGRILDKIDDIIIRVHGDQEPTTVADRAILALAETLTDAKVDYVRCWFPWKFFEPTLVPEEQLQNLLDNSYDKWPMDNFVKVLGDHGIDIIPVVACGYQRMLPEGMKIDADRAMYLKRAYIHTRLMVRRYGNKVRYWQIENEPNWWRMHEAGGWRSGVTWIDTHRFKEELLKVLNDAVHEEDSNAQTLINLEADSKLEDVSSYTRYCDMLGLDFYPNYRAASPINTSVFKLADQVANEIGKSVLILETGYPSGPFILGYTPSKQSEYIGKACLEAFTLQSVNAIGIWRYIDTPWKSFPDQENHFGLFDNHGNPKPAWRTLSEMIKKLK